MQTLLREREVKRPGRAARWSAVAAAVCLALGALGGRWLFSDRALYSYRNSEGSRLAVGQTVYAGLPANPKGLPPGDSRRLDLRSVHLRVTGNTSHATVSVIICRSRPGAPGSIVAGGIVTRIAPYCDATSPFHPGPMQLGPTADGLLVVVTPHTRGVVHLEGADVSYRDGLRRGSQHVGTEMTFTTGP